jgi:glycosidase
MIDGQPILLPIGAEFCPDQRPMEFHISARVRKACDFDQRLFASTGNVILANPQAVHLFTQKYNKTIDGTGHPERFLKSGQLNAMGLIDEIFHYVCRQYRETANRAFFEGAEAAITKAVGIEALNRILARFVAEFPPSPVFESRMDGPTWLSLTAADGASNRAIALEELMLLRLANENPAFEPFFPLFSDAPLAETAEYSAAWDAYRAWSAVNPPFGPEGRDLVSMLKAPVEYSPYDLKGQLEYIRTRWGTLLGDWIVRLLGGLDLIAEEEKPGWSGGVGGGSPEMDAYSFGDISKEYERFSPDKDWMPNVVLMAKSALVWLDQLSKKYGREIKRLDQIPDEELDFLADAGITGLWLIGLWERSPASARIKQICGNPEAAASAYSLEDYEIAEELGGWGALENLRARAWKRGVRMASDMVPNHTGMDAKWVVEKPDLFVQTRECPFPGYDFSGENLSRDGRVGVYLENHYYSKSDCAVVFKRVDNATGDTRYIYHGNDGTGMPWNDTAQIDFLNPEAREQVIQKILHVAANFPIIRFDAAMVLAKKHIQRLWYPEPGKGGDIASRSRFAISREEFERRIPEEFWREVVDRCAKEIPDTLLLAEAFWMMEGYFVRTLGMHRVYNSAFMNMLKREDNDKYRETIKNTIEFDPEILRRYVNFMNNPDEETAVAQFGRGDKYFGVCTMMVAMPGLPMFGHGQVEGLEEKYGMEYRRAYRDETPDASLVERHRREIFPLMKKRWLFAGVENFRLYDFWENGAVNENVFAWSNRSGEERALIMYNNKIARASGWIKVSAASLDKKPDGSRELVQRTLAEGLGLTVRDGRFCLMREQRSGLWFVRDARDIAERGLFANLDGFQTQAFVDIREVDDVDGRYRALHDSLGGRGIPDIHMGMQNIVLKELYAALSSLASPEFFTAVATLSGARGKTTARDKRLARTAIGKIGPAATAFYATCDTFIEGNYGAGALPGIKGRARGIGVEGARRRLTRILYRLCKPRAAWFIGGAIAKRLRAERGLAECAAAAAILDGLRDVAGTERPGETALSLVGIWDLDRKLQECVALATGEPANLDAIRVFTALMPLRDVTGRRNEQGLSGLYATVLANPSAKNAIDAHIWDGIEWFSKEKAESLVDAIALAAWASRSRWSHKIALARAKALAAIAKSEYKTSGIPTDKDLN